MNRPRSRSAHQKEEKTMKKWMALLLCCFAACCLLCLFVAGAMAEETVTLSLDGENEINIYPNGYQEKNKGFVSYKGPYIITGTSRNVDTCLDFYSIPYNAWWATQPVTYTVTFKDVDISAREWATAIRFGYSEGAGAKDITLNLINIGNSRVAPYRNHSVFSNQFSNKNRKVTVNIHNTSNSSLELAGSVKRYDDQSEWGVAGTNVTVCIGTKIIDNSNTEVKYTQTASQCELGSVHPARPETCNTQGNVLYWQCSICKTYAILDNRVVKSVLPEAVLIPAQHALTKVEAKDPTCTENGNIEYYRCTRDGCGKLFSDADGKIETTLSAVTLPAWLHALTMVEAKDPTCTAGGNIEYYRCTRNGCGKLFSDADGKTETTLSAVTLPARHALTKVEAKDPTCTADGNIEYYRCTRNGCGKLFADADGKTETPLSAVTLPAHHVLTLVPRKEPTYQQNGNIEYYCCTREGCGKLFADAEGKQELTPDDVILPMLVSTADLPQTGDTSNLALWTALLFISGGAAIGTTVVSRKKKVNR